MSTSLNPREIYQHMSRPFPPLVPGIWQDSTFGSLWKLSERTVDISAENPHFEKVVWPEKIADSFKEVT